MGGGLAANENPARGVFMVSFHDVRTNTFSADQWDDGCYFGIVTSIDIVLLW